MIFNSPEFLFAFLPILGILLFCLYRFKLDSFLVPTLLAASAFFYLYSSVLFAVILSSSIFINFFIGKQINHSLNRKAQWLIAGVLINIGYICLFKYTDIILGLFAVFGDGKSLSYTLPLGVSFYSFTQMGYLFDQFEGAKPEKKLINYSLFVSFFSTISSGPIIQNEDVGKQLRELTFKKFSIEKITRGFSLVLIGLFKKVILADYVASIGNSVYNAIDHKIGINSFEAWIGAISYSLQLYFDFSGYSDIAIGIGWMIGINLPWNFNSPYQAVNIVDFWRRWHMSLSTWLNNYVFEPVNYAVTKKLKSVSFLSKNIGLWGYLIGTFTTMFLCGLWHGATPNFILWGLFHIALIFTNRFWNMGKSHFGFKSTTRDQSKLTAWTNRLITFICVTFGWVLFRSVDLGSTARMWSAMIGGNGFYVPEAIANKLGVAVNNGSPSFFHLTSVSHYVFTDPILNIMITLILLLFIVFFLPNSREVMSNQCKILDYPYLRNIAKFLKIENGWQPSFVWLLIMSVMTISLVTWNKVSEFLYFNF